MEPRLGGADVLLFDPAQQKAKNKQKLKKIKIKIRTGIFCKKHLIKGLMEILSFFF